MSVKLTLNGRPVTAVQAASEIAAMLGRKAAAVATEAATQMAQDIREETPVKSGRAAGNWALTLNGEVPPYDPTLTGDGRGPVRDLMGRQPVPGDQITLVNSTPYILELEMGSSDKAPAGMVRVHVMNWQQYVRRAVRSR